MQCPKCKNEIDIFKTLKHIGDDILECTHCHLQQHIDCWHDEEKKQINEKQNKKSS